ncbi:cell division protein FtsB [Pseudonocardia sp. CNS-139]|nr:cell division protein FtsB [Pseudonocardia sp. CNS-139]
MARDPDTIQREIEQARDALADSLDALGDRANPKRFVDAGRDSVQARLSDPRIRYGLIALGVLLLAAFIRNLFR